MVQGATELDEFYGSNDPWGYEVNPEDKKRKEVLLGEIPKRGYGRVLDIGCGHGFVTRDLPGDSIVGVDISPNAIQQAKKYEDSRLTFMRESIFGLDRTFDEGFDLVIITGVLYPQYIGNSLNLVYLVVDSLLKDDGILVCVHIDEWYKGRFPYLTLKEHYYDYREYVHKLEVYVK